MPTGTVEDYIKSIYLLQENNERVSTSSLSAVMSISAPSVSEMIKRLADDGLVNYIPYKGVELTEAGTKKALQVIRRHRLWEQFLFQVLRFDWEDIHQEAERLEHFTSEKLEQKIDTLLGYPKYDPHGHCIPSSDGIVPDDTAHALASAAVGVPLRVVRVRDTDAALLRHLSRLGIIPGSDISIVEKFEIDGSMRLRNSGGEQYVSEVIAHAVFVERAERGEGVPSV